MDAEMSTTRTKIAFLAADYVVFGVMLVASAAIGVYYAWRERKKNIAEEDAVQDYLMGGRNMNFIPVAVSLSLSFISAITVLAVPADVYMYGSMYGWLVLCFLMVIPLMTEVYIPVFYRLGISSSFEYLQLRYNDVVRLFGTTIYLLQNVMYVGVVIYAPALAISSVTNLNLILSVLAVGCICTLYTTLGGLKAVIWTDVLQGSIVLLGLLLTMFACAESVGGWGVVWRANIDGGRVDFGVFGTDPRIRHSFWSVVVGFGFLWLSLFATNQSQVQRYLCCKTEKDAKKGILISLCVSSVLFWLSVLTGFVMYAYFKDCDPILNNEISESDQLVPYMVLSVFQGYPGLAGLFVSSVFAAALSTVSSGINAMACVTIEDFIRPYVTWSEGTLAKLSKALVFFYGILCIGFALVSQYLGGILQGSLSVIGIVGGPLLGIFSMGIIFPCANSKGACVGMVSGMAMTTWIFIGAITYGPKMEFFRMKSRVVDGCATKVIVPTSAPQLDRPAISDTFYAVSYGYYTAIGFGITLLVGLIVSMFTNGWRGRTEVNPKLLRALLDHRMFRWLPEKFRRFMWCGVEFDKVDKHEVVPIPQPPPSIQRRWSSRERVNSLRLSLRMWKDTTLGDLEHMTSEQRAVMAWKAQQYERGTRTNGERQLVDIQEDDFDDRTQTSRTIPGKLKQKSKRAISETRRSHKTNISENVGLKDKLSPYHTTKINEEESPSLLSSDVESGVPSMWI